jgi:hypothetical protein
MKGTHTFLKAADALDRSFSGQARGVVSALLGETPLKRRAHTWAWLIGATAKVELLPLKDRTTLFAERADAFLVILAVEALRQHFVERAQIAHLRGT